MPLFLNGREKAYYNAVSQSSRQTDFPFIPEYQREDRLSDPWRKMLMDSC